MTKIDTKKGTLSAVQIMEGCLDLLDHLLLIKPSSVCHSFGDKKKTPYFRVTLIFKLIVIC